MSLIKFEEVLNDLVDYFLIGDPVLLMDYKNDKQLPDDLMAEFTTSIDGDHVVEEGILIPLSRVENYPYTVYFNLGGDAPELLKSTSRLQVQQDGYKMQVKYGTVYLFTVPYLRRFTGEVLENLVKTRTTKITLPNGWYQVSVLGGETEQETGMEPTFEFLITPVTEETEFTADLMYPFNISASEY
ncbi:hypothetical protein [Pedobacter metabolipauper]|uniref:Uncharacterized protein n=1 Tax=Pedobacter metabolipauper TaxID=425513 RepID=A0A4R6SSB5_9SPHI|nr:hypothetical protein [Pedobacter metabolipauper]TDQ06233.1 hypothetical protein ATK78_4614 [Pedobacter metabolipauper]